MERLLMWNRASCRLCVAVFVGLVSIGSWALAGVVDDASTAIQRGDYATAQQTLDNALPAAKRAGGNTLAELQSARGANLTLLHKWDAAAAALDEAKAISERNNDT